MRMRVSETMKTCWITPVFHNSLVIASLLSIIVCAQLEYSQKCVKGGCFNGKCTNDTCVCDRGWGGHLCQSCHGRVRLEEDSGVITDGKGNYSSNEACTWLLDTELNKPIKLRINNFSTECAWDYLSVFDGPSVYSPLVATLSGQVDSSRDVVLQSGKGFVYFSSDVEINGAGFNITYSVQYCPDDCSGHGDCDTSNTTCICEPGWSGPSCNIALNPDCPGNCSGHGSCVHGNCLCNISFTGSDCAVNAAQKAYWEPVSSSNSIPARASFGADVFRDHLYIFGGDTMYARFLDTSNSTQDSTQLYRYSFTSGVWEKMIEPHAEPSMSSRQGHTLTADKVSNSLYMFGGKVGADITNELWQYSIATNTWSQLNSSDSVPVTGHSAHLINGSLYFFFGYSVLYNFYAGVQCYNISFGKWTTLPKEGAPVIGHYGHTTVFDEASQTVYLYGGLPWIKNKYSDLYSFNPLTHIWSALPSSKGLVYQHAAVLWQGFLIVYGGVSSAAESSSTQYYSSQVTAFDLVCREWFTVNVDNHLIQGASRQGHKMFIYKNDTFVYGGYNGFMLSDMFKLKTPLCSSRQTKADCVGQTGSLGYAGSDRFCIWNDLSATCLESTIFSRNPSSCNPVRDEDCHMIKDCLTCHNVEFACQWNPDSKICTPASGTISSASKLSCSGTLCSIYSNCRSCNQRPGCMWNGTGGFCMYASSTTLKSACAAECSSYSHCTNCTNSSACIWCDRLQRCVDVTTYAINFPYGQCFEWASKLGRSCEDLACEQISSCEDCLLNPMCGWCNDPADTGAGGCLRGIPTSDLANSCPKDNWYFHNCSACQCNGHSTCSPGGDCLNCTAQTTGNHCETCADGFFGKTENGGTCKLCNCDEVADSCHPGTGACFCRVQGAIGSRCDTCDDSRGYISNPDFPNQCFYTVGMDYRYTFNFSKAEDRNVTSINVACQPQHDDRDVDLEIYCYGEALVNLTLYSTKYANLYHEIKRIEHCNGEKITLTIDHADYPMGIMDGNASFLLSLYSFQTPFSFQVAFTQYARIDLFKFFLVFFGSFLALLIIAGVAWKVRVRFLVMQQRRVIKAQMRTLASRPFASILIPQEQLDDHYHSTTNSQDDIVQAQPGKKYRMKEKTTSQSPTMIALEPLAYGKVGVVTVMVKLPTGEDNVPPIGQSGTALASTLIVIGQHSSQLAAQKVVYKEGKVKIKTQASFDPV